ncbi:PREDICTED: glutamate receptor ionotropic, delta-2 [Nicrophorus vespilloides]|uniref:Glutamate receptor ionotropic, delta-2 n=1 Tax=Nicrophorus vespilloides TaxID=110193 RepID=A0ABM1MH82_NICVS|nr:PREDICTED: glutamate receptor ionotropic, delta-2 [Nicrophorus vespilloides]
MLRGSLILAFCIASTFALHKGGLTYLLDDVTEEKQDLERLLSDVLFNTLKPYKCIAILCDDVYYSIFKDHIFKKMGLFISYFFILIESSDDLLSPFPDTKDALNMIKKQDCQMYVILMANGLQLSRLLIYGDRYRVLDTRANFVFLYDNRILHKDLYYLWKRMVNVIFIKEYAGSKKSSGEIIPWFELSTVPFPSPIKGVFIPRRIDIWRRSKFRKGVDLFRDKTYDLKNQTLKVAVFQHIPAAIKMEIPEHKSHKTVVQYGDSGYSGIEIEILATISKAMNFNPEMYEPQNAESEFWGIRQPDGQYSGLFGELVSSKADIGLGDFYYTNYILDLMDLTIPYYTECLTFLTPEALSDNSWKTLILPFKPLMWTCVLLSLFICAFLFHFLAIFHRRINRFGMDEKIVATRPIQVQPKLNVDAKYRLMRQQHEVLKEEDEPEGLYVFAEPVNSFLYTYSMLLVVSLPKLPTGWSLRMLTGWFWLYCTLVVVSYRASMTAILANPTPRVTIDNLQEIIDSKISVGGWGEINRILFSTSLDPPSQEIGDKFEIINDTDYGVDRVALGTFALYENTHFLKYSSVKRQLRILNDTKLEGQDGDRNLHIMSDCVINMPISIGLQKNSPIKPMVDKFIRRVIEAGLVGKWLDDIMSFTMISETSNEERVKALMDMKKFFGAIVALFIGITISVSVFFAEILYFNRYIRKHPNFDKYSKVIQHEKKQ